MADDRPIDGAPEEIGRLTRELEELRAMMNARFSRRPTGDIEPTIRTSAKASTLLLQGQTVTRAAYPTLWAWVQSNALVRPGLFTAGDGTTTFGLPNFSGRVPIGAGTLGADIYAVGALLGEARVTLTEGQMPGHSHGGSTGSDSHSHGGSTGGGGDHNGHTSQSNVNHASGTGANGFHGHPPSWGNGNGGHSHSLSTSSDAHSHSLAINQTGGGQGHENRPPSIAVGWLIWT